MSDDHKGGRTSECKRTINTLAFIQYSDSMTNPASSLPGVGVCVSEGGSSCGCGYHEAHANEAGGGTIFLSYSAITV